MKFQYYLQRFNQDFPVFTSGISIHLANFYVGQNIKTGELSKDELITIAFNERKNSEEGFWNLIVKLDLEEAKNLHDKLGKVINAYGKMPQLLEEVLPSDHI